MFCWPCIIVYQYNETSVMHFSFNLLRIKSLYMFRALLAHPQEPLHKRHLVYCVHMSAGCAGLVAVKLTYARNIPNAFCVTPPEDEQVMLEICRGSWFSINWMKRASLWFHYTDYSITLHNFGISNLTGYHYKFASTCSSSKAPACLHADYASFTVPTKCVMILSNLACQRYECLCSQLIQFRAIYWNFKDYDPSTIKVCPTQ
jgi:hypothetical protein